MCTIISTIISRGLKGPFIEKEIHFTQLYITIICKRTKLIQIRKFRKTIAANTSQFEERYMPAYIALKFRQLLVEPPSNSNNINLSTIVSRNIAKGYIFVLDEIIAPFV